MYTTHTKVGHLQLLIKLTFIYNTFQWRNPDLDSILKLNLCGDQIIW